MLRKDLLEGGRKEGRERKSKEIIVQRNATIQKER